MSSYGEPTRSCAGCNLKAPKRHLIRIVRSKSGEVELDLYYNKIGRGVYICSSDCFGVAVKKKRLDYKLRGQISQGNLHSLKQYFESM